jgi:UDP-N-acetylglucosamine 2-epimerase (hydrolysing)
VLESGWNYVVIFPNNDHGTDLILGEYERLRNHPRFRVFPSMRFEYFLALLRDAEFMIGNSSAGVREAPHFGVPALNLGSRQNNRVKCPTILDVPIEAPALKGALARVPSIPRTHHALFGDGSSAMRFHAILKGAQFWNQRTQKYFVDRVLHAG